MFWDRDHVLIEVERADYPRWEKNIGLKTTLYKTLKGSLQDRAANSETHRTCDGNQEGNLKRWGFPTECL